MDFGLGHGDTVEHGEGAAFDRFGKGGGGDEGADGGVIPGSMGMGMPMAMVVMIVPVIMIVGMGMVVIMSAPARFFPVSVVMGMIMGVVMSVIVGFAMGSVGFAFVDLEVDGGDGHALDFLDVEVEGVGEVEFPEFPFEGGGFETEVDEGTEEHVAAESGETIEVEGLHRTSIKAADGGEATGKGGWGNWAEITTTRGPASI
jgi:hypothetical protein